MISQFKTHVNLLCAGAHDLFVIGIHAMPLSSLGTIMCCGRSTPRRTRIKKAKFRNRSPSSQGSGLELIHNEKLSTPLINLTVEIWRLIEARSYEFAGEGFVVEKEC